MHCCPLVQDPQADYNPIYKIKEVRVFLEERFQKLFVPKQQLSLDETLICAFGRIKFKVWIISKLARYGIKVYVLTNAQTAFALKVIVYTGSTTYNKSTMLEEKKKTVDIMERLCKPYFDISDSIC